MVAMMCWKLAYSNWFITYIDSKTCWKETYAASERFRF